MNKTKKEVVCPWCLGDDAVAAEWSPNILGAIFALMMPCESDGNGDGNEHGVMMKVDRFIAEHFERAMRNGIPKVKEPINDINSIVGRWADDDVYLVGNPEVELYQESFGYRNISLELAVTWNSIVGDEDMQLEYSPECECEPIAEAKV